MSTVEDILDRLGTLIVRYPGLIILLFLTLTGVFAVGLVNVEAEEGTEEFAEGVDAYDAGENIAPMLEYLEKKIDDLSVFAGRARNINP